MKPKSTCKSVACIVALLIVLSSVMVLNWDVRAEERLEGNIEGTILAYDGSIIPDGFTVQLIDKSQDEVITASSDGGYFMFDGVDIGYYDLIIPWQTHGRKAYLTNSTENIRVEEGDTEYVNINVEVRDLKYTLSGRVYDPYGEPLVGATVTLSDDDRYTASTTVDLIEEENKTVAYYEIRAYEAVFDVRIEAKGYAPNITSIDFDSDKTMNVTLTDSPIVSGYIWTIEDGREKAVRAPSEVTLIRDDGTIIRNTMTKYNPWFYIGAAPGDYTLIVSSQGYMPYMEDISLDGNNKPLGRCFVDPAEDELINTEITVDDEWNSISITRERKLHANSRILGLDYWYLGNLAMQIDMTYGNGDMDLNETELLSFVHEYLAYREANIPSSENLIKINGITYEQSEYNIDIKDYQDLLGDVTNTTAMDVTVSSTRTYTTDEDICVEDGILIDLMVARDRLEGNLRDNHYTLVLPDGYKRISSYRESIPEGVEVSRHIEIEVNPGMGVGKAHLVFDIRQVEEGEVFVSIDETVHSYYDEDEEAYIVKQGENITAIADFVNPYDEPAESYTWFIDGDDLDLENATIEYKFEEEGTFELRVVVVDTARQTFENSTTVIVDGTGPQGDIYADNTTVEERQRIEFSAYDFESVSDIREFLWNFSDGSEHVRGTNVTHAFELYGEYEVSVNATDRLGNWNVETITIVVTDATDPVARFAISYDEERKESDNITVISIQRGKEIELDASISYDPAGFEVGRQNVTSVWWWISGIEEGYSDEVKTITFDRVGTYRISLNVTDEAGNYHNISRTIEVVPGPAPSLEVTEVRLSTDDLTTNKKVQVIASVTNYGAINATDISVIFRVDGRVRSITPRFYISEDNETTLQTIPEGETRLIKFDWTPDEHGNIRLSVNVTDSAEHMLNGNEHEIRVTVEAPAWRRYVGYIVVPIVIIGVAVGLYFYKDNIKAMLNR